MGTGPQGSGENTHESSQVITVCGTARDAGSVLSNDNSSEGRGAEEDAAEAGAMRVEAQGGDGNGIGSANGSESRDARLTDLELKFDVLAPAVGEETETPEYFDRAEVLPRKLYGWLRCVLLADARTGFPLLRLMLERAKRPEPC